MEDIILEKKVNGYKRHELTDIKLTAFLLIQDGIDLVDAFKFKNESNKKMQFKFVVENKTDIPLKQWILDYQNDKVLVSVRAYNKKLEDLKDIIHSNI